MTTLQTSTSDLGTTIQRNKLVDLPLFVGGNVRNLEQFIFLAPGVTGDTGNTQISGSPNRAKEVLVDGIASTGIESGGVIPGSGRPSVETIGEFRLLRANFNAEYGRTGGGVQIFTTRSGTNDLHGSVFDYLRNDKFDARGFFQPQTGNQSPERVRRCDRWTCCASEALRRSQQDVLLFRVQRLPLPSGRAQLSPEPDSARLPAGRFLAVRKPHLRSGDNAEHA